MRDLLRGLLDLLWPPLCAGCGGGVSGTAALCRRCDAEIARTRPEACALCQEAWPAHAQPLCLGCAAARSPLEACVAAVRYGGATETWIRRFKYPRPGLAGLDPAPGGVVRAWVLESAARVAGPRPSLVTPIPLHPRRLRERGFNPSTTLARGMARELNLAFDPVLLRRLRDTPSQTGLDRASRRRNVRGAFAVRRGASVPARVWLVDDVVTTGATLTEAARTLRCAGAEQVIGVCAVRTLGREAISSSDG